MQKLELDVDSTKLIWFIQIEHFINAHLTSFLMDVTQNISVQISVEQQVDLETKTDSWELL